MEKVMSKILVMDDDDAIRYFYQEELSSEGYEVFTTGDCRSLLNTIKEQKPDVIVLDIMMEGYNGLDLLQKIRNTYWELPVILCTSYPIFKYEPKSVSADYFVVKNSDLSNLKIEVEKAIEDCVQSSTRIGMN
jgi:DNA-binding NtrC family response regulator